jgi:hypothetical protein
LQTSLSSTGIADYAQLGCHLLPSTAEHSIQPQSQWFCQCQVVMIAKMLYFHCRYQAMDEMITEYVVELSHLVTHSYFIKECLSEAL